MPSSYPANRIRITHRCGHAVTYRRGAEWPEHRYCFTCSEARAEWMLRRIEPHVKTQKGRFAVLAIMQELLEHEFTREIRAERNGRVVGEAGR